MQQSLTWGDAMNVYFVTISLPKCGTLYLRWAGEQCWLSVTTNPSQLDVRSRKLRSNYVAYFTCALVNSNDINLQACAQRPRWQESAPKKYHQWSYMQQKKKWIASLSKCSTGKTIEKERRNKRTKPLSQRRWIRSTQRGVTHMRWKSVDLFLKAGPPPPWFEFLVIFDFFAPWYRRGWEASSVKIL